MRAPVDAKVANPIVLAFAVAALAELVGVGVVVVRASPAYRLAVVVEAVSVVAAVGVEGMAAAVGVVVGVRSGMISALHAANVHCEPRSPKQFARRTLRMGGV